MPRDSVVFDVAAFPKVTYPDIVNYLVFGPSPFTMEDMRAYKSLEAYNQFVCGWVRDLGVILAKDDVFVLVARVRHDSSLQCTELPAKFAITHVPTIRWSHVYCAFFRCYTHSD